MTPISCEKMRCMLEKQFIRGKIGLSGQILWRIHLNINLNIYFYYLLQQKKYIKKNQHKDATVKTARPISCENMRLELEKHSFWKKKSLCGKLLRKISLNNNEKIT